MNETKVQEHTAEPWTWLEGKSGSGAIGVVVERPVSDGPDPRDAHIEQDFEQHAHAEPLANARRIVACVNACAGLSTEALERGDLAYVLAAYKANNDTTRDSYIAVIDGATYRGLKGGAA